VFPRGCRRDTLTAGVEATIAVLGATGVYGRHLIPRTRRARLPRPRPRRPEAAAVAAACGASLRAGLEGCDVGINLATSLPGPSGRGDYATNDRVRREGTPIWVQACRDVGVPRIVQQSIALVNAGAGDAWADEDTVFSAGQEGTAALAVAAALAMEDTGAALHDVGYENQATRLAERIVDARNA